MCVCVMEEMNVSVTTLFSNVTWGTGPPISIVGVGAGEGEGMEVPEERVVTSQRRRQEKV